jgi:LPS-assembly protein
MAGIRLELLDVDDSSSALLHSLRFTGRAKSKKQLPTAAALCIRSIVFAAVLCSALEVQCRSVKGQYFLEADKIEYKSKEQTIVATGHVEVSQKLYLLRADSLVYHRATNKVEAHGNVLLVKPNGEELYARSLELEDELKKIVAIQLTARLNDNNVFSASTATETEDKIIFNKATYSPCNICKESSPQWQVRASTIDYGKKKNTVFINNFFDLYGMPVFYLPYMQVASYDAPPRSGLLLPNNYKYNSIYGHGIEVPYYLRINDSNDLTYSPRITSKKIILHSAKYRFMLQEGHLNNIYVEYISSNKHKLTNTKGNEFYLKAHLVHDLTEKLKFRSDLEHVSHKSYLKNYHEENRNYLRSFAELNYLDESSRLEGGINNFQELRSAAYGRTDIIVAPVIEYDKTILDGSNRYTINADAASITKRKHGVIDEANVILTWLRNYRHKNHLMDVSCAVNLSARKFVKADDQNDDRNRNYTFGTMVPEFSTAWRYPLLLRSHFNITQVEPIIRLIAIPSSLYNRNTINEDSQDIEITDSNIFDINRYAGTDRLENGVRLAYGVTGAGYFHDSGYPIYGFVFGQNYRFTKSNDYSFNSGLKNTNFSDYVGRLSFKTSSMVELYDMFQLDKNKYKFRKNEVGATFTFDIPEGKINKITLDTRWSAYDYKENLYNIKQSVTLGGAIHLLKEWRLAASATKNIANHSWKLIEARGSLGYSGQCTNILFSAIKNNTSDPTRKIIKGGLTYSIEVHLKNLN